MYLHLIFIPWQCDLKANYVNSFCATAVILTFHFEIIINSREVVKLVEFLSIHQLGFQNGSCPSVVYYQSQEMGTACPLSWKEIQGC